jgi:wobble nucleotide-excising tRNase
MIKRIEKIKNIRSFLDFETTDIELNKKNIFYSPNGTGKTNLSRIFNRIKKGECIDDLKSQEAIYSDKPEFTFVFKDNQNNEIEINNDNYIDQKFLRDKLFIFNSEYVEQNVRCNNFSIKDINGNIQIPIGTDNSEVINMEQKIEDEKIKRDDLYTKLKDKIQSIKKTKIDSKEYKKSDKKTWEEFSIDKLISAETFDINVPQIEKSFKDCEENYKNVSKLDENCKFIYPVKKIDLSNINFSELINLLKDSKKFAVFDQDIKNNIKYITNKWITEDLIVEAIKGSREKNKCLLCKRVLTDEVSILFNKYEEYLNNEESKFKKNIRKSIEELSKIRDLIKDANNNYRDTANKYINLLDIAKNINWIEFDNEDILVKINLLIDNLTNKIDNPIEDFFINALNYEFESNITILNDAISTNIDNASIINRKILKTQKRMTELRSIIGKKFLYYFYLNNKEQIDKLSRSVSSIKIYNEELLKLKEKLPKSSVSKNTEEICNKFLHEFLLLKKYKIEENKGVLYLKLKGKNISEEMEKISEGEKNMIAFCFFLASSIKELDTLDRYLNAVFIIDDPVCSMSYDYIFGVCNLLKEYDGVIIKKLWNFEKGDMNVNYNIQKIILTHNTQLFNILASHIFKNSDKKSSTDDYFLLSNSNIEKINRTKLRSEFELAVHNIKKAALYPNNEHNIGNDLRRFFETLKYFYGLKEGFNNKTLKKIFPDFENPDHLIFFSVIQYYSHGSPEGHNDPLRTSFKPFIEQFDKLIKKSQFEELWKNVGY